MPSACIRPCVAMNNQVRISTQNALFLQKILHEMIKTAWRIDMPTAPVEALLADLDLAIASSVKKENT